jgi:AbrB family looped-hinge helix DNA binding protein
MIVKQNYADMLDSIGMFEDAHDEFAVLDKAGRVQIPAEMLEKIGLQGNKVKLEVEDGKVVISVPQE